MTHDNKVQEVRAIENGTVIDHIPSDQLFKIIRIMQLDRAPQRITFGINLESKRMGSKAIIKIADRYCLDKEINRIALFAPMAMVNTIKDFEVIEKRKVLYLSALRVSFVAPTPSASPTTSPFARHLT